ncbi:YtxH domain-containing protein [Candidatus Nitronereus thalassa]|uniref:YtxH domain-containing protein n=1 Tax=Candidatus Nitronereus thalassa TaxID=3020898 RepID=A0ABU3K5L1_9BACT|nr:YtxH domain-containing protein [Candidatus Nitronereus thalassa]MDT7041714.1 YtxH domain-containing protein [Candidatus Nitronereus thalassa]
MEESNRALVFGFVAFFAGVMIGLGTGLLVAPQSGNRTRRQLQNMAMDAQEDAETLVKDTKEKVSGWVDKGKKLMANS